MPSCSGMSIAADTGFACAGAAAGLRAATVSARGLGGVMRTGLGSATGAGFASAARAGFTPATRAGFDAAARSGSGAVDRAGFAAGAFAGATLEVAGGRGRAPVLAGLRAAAREGFDATFFTSTSAVREPWPGWAASRRARRGIPSRAGGRGASTLERHRDAFRPLSHVRPCRDGWRHSAQGGGVGAGLGRCSTCGTLRTRGDLAWTGVRVDSDPGCCVMRVREFRAPAG